MPATAINGDVLRSNWCTLSAVGLVCLNFQFGGHDWQRSLQIVFLILFALAAAASGRASALGALPDMTARRLLGTMLALGAISAGLSFSPRHAFYELSSLTLLVLLACAVAAEVARNAVTNTIRLLQAIGWVCVLYAVKVAVVYLTALALGAPPDVYDLSPGFDNYRFLNHAQTVTLPLLVLLFLVEPTNARVHLIWFALASFWWALLCVTAARGSMAGLAVGIVAALVLRPRHAVPFVKAMAATALAGAVLYVVGCIAVPALLGMAPVGELTSMVERTVADPASGRGRLWQRAIALILAHPLFGVGPLHFAHFGADLRNGAHPHNWALQVGAEWGLPAFLCLVSTFVLCARGLARTAGHIDQEDQRNQHILVAFVATGAAVLIDGLVSGVIVMPQSQLLIALYVGCAAGWSTGFRERTHATGVGLALVLVAAALVLGATTWPDLVALLRHEPVHGHEDPFHSTSEWPRLWRQGHF